MNKVPFHEAKEFLLKKIKIDNEIGESPIKIMYQNESTQVDLKLDNSVDLFDVLSIFAKTVENVQLSSLLNQYVYLTYSDARLIFQNNYSKEIRLSKKGDLTSVELDCIIKSYELLLS